MTRLLAYDERKRLQGDYRNNPLMQLIVKSYLPIANRMNDFRFSPEELWLNTLMEIARLAALDEREREDHLARLWDELYADLRDDAHHEQRPSAAEELRQATSCVLLFVAVGLRGSDQPELYLYADSLFAQAAEHYAQSAELVSAICSALTEEVGCFVQDYLASGIRVGELLSGKGTEIKPRHLSQRQKAELKERATMLLGFMKGKIRGSEEAVMKRADFDRLIEAIKRLIDRGRVEVEQPLLETGLKVDELRYTFYLLWKHWSPYVEREQVVDLLKATFAKFEFSSKETISKKFATRPEGYDYIAEGPER